MSTTPTMPAPGQLVPTPEFSAEEALIVTQARELVVTDQVSLERATTLLTAGIKAARKKIAAFFEPMKRTAKAAHQAVCDREQEIDRPWAEAEWIAKRTIQDFLAEQQRIADQNRRVEQVRLDEEAKANRKEEIQQAKDLGAPAAEVRAIRQTAAVAPAAAVHQEVTTKGTGVSLQYDYSAEIEQPSGKQQIVAYVLQNWQAFNHIVMVNESEINKLAKSQKELFQFPGARLRKTPRTSARAK